MSVLLGLVDTIGCLAALVLLALLFQHLRLLAAHGRLADRLLAETPSPGPLAPPDAPRVLVQIPLFDEPAAAAGAVEAAARLAWPEGRITVQILDDSTDETPALVAAAIRRLDPDGRRFHHVRRAGRDGYKAGALAAGLEGSDAAYVAILDADHRPLPEWLAHAVARLEAEPTVAFLQSRFEPSNGEANALTRAQALLIDSHFVIEQTGRLARGGPIQFNGTAGVWRRAAIDAAGGWSGATLAEDLDLAMRAALSGWDGRLSLAPAVACEVPERLGDWRRQQGRWSRGFAAVARQTVPAILGSSWRPRRKADGLALLLIQAGLPAGLVAGLAFVADAALRGFGPGHAAIFAAAALIVVAAAMALTWPAYRRLRRGGPIRYATALAGVPALLAVMAVAHSAAVLTARPGLPEAFLRTPKSGHG